MYNMSSDYNTIDQMIDFFSIGSSFLILIFIISLVLSVLILVSIWKIFKKFNKPGWYSIVPFLNLWTLFEISGIKGFWSIIPIANVIFLILLLFKLPVRLGRTAIFGLGLLFLPYVFFPILAFSKETLTLDEDLVKEDDNDNIASEVPVKEAMESTPFQNDNILEENNVLPEEKEIFKVDEEPVIEEKNKKELEKKVIKVKQKQIVKPIIPAPIGQNDSNLKIDKDEFPVIIPDDGDLD